MLLRTRKNFLLPYMANTPLPLAFERYLECLVLSGKPFERPVLDVGCGDGFFASILFDDKIDTGIDPDEREVEHAKGLGAYSELIVCRGDAIPKPDGFYRTIFSNSVLEHIPDLDPVLKEVGRLLAPGGRFYMTVPSADFDRYSVFSRLLEALQLPGLAARYRRFYNSFWKHYHYYSEEVWKARLETCGFTIVESYTYDPPWLCFLNDLLVPLSFPEWLTKRLFNRWTLAPVWEKICRYPIFVLASSLLRGAARCNRGGLVFLALTRDSKQ